MSVVRRDDVMKILQMVESPTDDAVRAVFEAWLMGSKEDREAIVELVVAVLETGRPA